MAEKKPFGAGVPNHALHEKHLADRPKTRIPARNQAKPSDPALIARTNKTFEELRTTQRSLRDTKEFYPSTFILDTVTPPFPAPSEPLPENFDFYTVQYDLLEALGWTENDITTLHEAAERHRDDFVGELDEYCHKAVFYYSYDLWKNRPKNLFANMNRSMYSKDLDLLGKCRDYIIVLRRAVHLLSTNSGPATTYRGCPRVDESGVDLLPKFQAEYSVNKVVSFAAFNSSSLSRDVAVSDFLLNQTGFLFVLSLKNAPKIKEWSCRPQEEEVLLNPGSKFRVTSWENQTLPNGAPIFVVNMEQI